MVPGDGSGSVRNPDGPDSAASWTRRAPAPTARRESPRAFSVRSGRQSRRVPAALVSDTMWAAACGDSWGYVTHRLVRLRLPPRDPAADRPDRGARNTRSWPTRDAETRRRDERQGWTNGRHSGTHLLRQTGSARSVFGGFDRLGSTHAAEGDAAEDVFDRPRAELGIDDGKRRAAAERAVRMLEPPRGRVVPTER